MTKISLDSIADAFGMRTKPDADVHVYGTVQAINADKSYQVRFDGSSVNTRAAAMCGASVGDRVLCVVHDGQAAAIGRTTASVLSEEDTKTVATATGTSVCSVTLPPGTWIVSGTVQFTSNATGRRFVNLSTTDGYATNTASGGESRPAASGGATTCNRVRVFVPIASLTVYLNAWQNSGGDLSCVGNIQAVRIY